jgi:hypothetical protein
MTDFVSIQYPDLERAPDPADQGMREMQRKAFAKRASQYLLIKSPPASGKSRALMYVGLDKLREQGLRKLIVAVPEKTIAASFAPVLLTKDGFAYDWHVEPHNDLCGSVGAVKNTTAAFARFMESDDEILLCTHATLRFAFDAMGDDAASRAAAFAECVVAVDEFHHGSADEENRLGAIVRALVADGRSHIVAMTGSYFRGDRAPVMRIEDEERFARVTYTYYDQLAGYRHLKTLTLGYAFYDSSRDEGVYAAVGEAMNLDERTIIHLPFVNSAAADAEGKIAAMNRIVDQIGEWRSTDPTTGFMNVMTTDGRIVKIAELVTTDTQSKIQDALRKANANRDAVNVVIAQNMAKEGFDWIWCEHAIRIGTINSMTEVVQIIGRTTRDAPGKTRARFTNLIAEPNNADEEVREAVNAFMKAIAISLLMEQVTMPNFQFRTKPADLPNDWHHPQIDGSSPNTSIIHVKGLKEPVTARGREIIENMPELMAVVAQDERVTAASLAPERFQDDYVAKVVIPDIIEKRYGIGPDHEDAEAIRQDVLLRQTVTAQLRQAVTVQQPGFVLIGGKRGTDESIDDRTTAASATSAFLDLSKKMLMVGEFDIDLIDHVNPFQQSYEIVSKGLDETTLRAIHGLVGTKEFEITEAEAMLAYPKIKEFEVKHGHKPRFTASDAQERRLAEAVIWIRNEVRKRKMANPSS